jgi:hypothetical protein
MMHVLPARRAKAGSTRQSHKAIGTSQVKMLKRVKFSKQSDIEIFLYFSKLN